LYGNCRMSTPAAPRGAEPWYFDPWHTANDIGNGCPVVGDTAGGAGTTLDLAVLLATADATTDASLRCFVRSRSTTRAFLMSWRSKSTPSMDAHENASAASTGLSGAHTAIHSHTKPHRHTDTQTHRHTDTQTHNHTHTHTYNHTCAVPTTLRTSTNREVASVAANIQAVLSWAKLSPQRCHPPIIPHLAVTPLSVCTLTNTVPIVPVNGRERVCERNVWPRAHTTCSVHVVVAVHERRWLVARRGRRARA